MAGFSKIYCIGDLGGFQGADGISAIRLQIWVGDADRQWLEPHYIERRLRPIGAVQKLIPKGPDHPDSLIDACIAFYPDHFKNCPTLAAVDTCLAEITQLDFDLGSQDIPKEWSILRQEAWPLYRTLNIFEAQLHPLENQEDKS